MNPQPQSIDYTAAPFCSERLVAHLSPDRLRFVANLFANGLANKNLAEELVEARARVGLTVEAAGLGLWTWNVRQDEIWASDKAHLLFGWPDGTRLTHKDFLNSVHPEDRTRVRDSLAAAVLLPMEFQEEYRAVCSDGTTRWISVRGRSDPDAAGKPTSLSGVVEDATKREFAADRLCLAVEVCPIAIIVVDTEGKILLANTRVEAIFGYQCKELIGQSINGMVPPRFHAAFAAHRTVFTAHPSIRPIGAGLDLYGVRKDGSEVPIEIRLNSFQSGENSPVLIAITDITDRTHALETLCSNEVLFRRIANLAPALIWVSDKDARRTFVSESWLTFTGRTLKEELEGGWASEVHPDDVNRCLEGYSAAFKAHVGFEMEYRLRRYDGKYCWVADRGKPSFEADGTFRGYVGSCVDITEQKQSEESLIEANVRLLEAYRQIQELKQKLEHENIDPEQEIKLERDHHEVVGRSEAIRRVLMKAEKVAVMDSTVLLLGETGTGKELIARAIHASSKRTDRLMVKVNCATLPASLVESELFGRERGAFTGALTREIGRFELADQSTIFLDEIGEVPLQLQAKLLRVLQEGDFERLGSPRSIHVDVRVIAATSCDLEEAVREGRFREDLYYRLNVFPIYIPPLRERQEDIPMLMWHFLRDLGGRMGRNVETVRTETINAFRNYSWPGNVRELRNVIERHLITHSGSVFEAELPEPVRVAGLAERTVAEVERNHIRRVLDHTGWRVRGRGAAAETLGLKPTTLESRMRKLGILRQ